MIHKNANDREFEIGSGKVTFVILQYELSKIAITQRYKDDNLKVKSFNTVEEALNWVKIEGSVQL